jgi:hypothetical protein
VSLVIKLDQQRKVAKDGLSLDEKLAKKRRLVSKKLCYNRFNLTTPKKEE